VPKTPTQEVDPNWVELHVAGSAICPKSPQPDANRNSVVIRVWVTIESIPAYRKAILRWRLESSPRLRTRSASRRCSAMLSGRLRSLEKSTVCRTDARDRRKPRARELDGEPSYYPNNSSECKLADRVSWFKTSCTKMPIQKKRP